MRKAFILWTAALALCAGCVAPGDSAGQGELARFLDAGPRFVRSRSFRRRALERSLVNPANGYSQLRLANYARGQAKGGRADSSPANKHGWDALPLWNPPVRPVTTADFGRFDSAPFATSDATFAPVFDAEVPWTAQDMLRLGRRAFENYPLEVDPALVAGQQSRARADEVGLWVDRRGRVGGLVRVRLPDGSESTAVTCATCHSAPDAARQLVYGRTNTRLARDEITSLYVGGPAASDWGRGQVDVTPDGVDNPTAITDLRAVRHQSYLHWAATLRNSPLALAVRLETLMITSLHQRRRPPRQIAVALAYYVWSLGEDGRGSPHLGTAAKRGQALFDAQCARCHHADGTSAGTASLAEIGTDPRVAESPMRTTGRWRIPSLWRVSQRGQFLHDGSVTSLADLLDPARLHTTPGHAFGTRLSSAERRDLVAYLDTL